ncbi:MAG: hypothetical protein HY537_12700 [Deltaproteobacteria bacterium]|nr:hypothetical protein [Deltaproteobacteria bacterium]
MRRTGKHGATPKLSWERRVEYTLALGQFISWDESSEFRDDLCDLLNELVQFEEKHPKSALPIFDILIAGTLEKGNEIDDSGDDLGSFLDELACAWTECCVSAGMSGDEYIRKLVHWMNADSIGFFHDLEMTVIPSLNKEYRAALEQELKKRLEMSSKETPESGREQHRIDANRRDAIATLKKLYTEAKNSTALIEFCEQYGLDQEACLALASIFHTRKQLDRALEWAEKGLKLKDDRYGKEYELKELRRKILKDSGRGCDAVADAWTEFAQHPSIYSFDSVLESATKKEHANLKAKAITIFEKADLREAAVALHKLKEFDRLAIRIATSKPKSLQSIFYGDAIPIAESLSKKYPKEAASLYVVQALEILAEKRAKAYHHAHDYLQSAKTLLEKCGETTTWLTLVTRIRSEHKLKSSFMPGFEKIAAGEGAPRSLTFKERIAKRLDPGSGRDQF